MSRREFHFSDGSSNKFWAIDVQGTQFTVQFGRLGTAGQTQTKQFASEAEAQKAADKLIAEKTGKGYSEVGAASTAAAAAPKPKSPPASKGKKEAQPPVSPPPAASPPAPVIVRRIDLQPQDWLVATWRPRDQYVTPRPQAKPFDLAACLQGYQERQTQQPGGWWSWTHQPLPTPLSAEEAHFWARALTYPKPKTDPKNVARELAGEKFDGRVSAAELARWVANRGEPKWALRGDYLFQVIPYLLSPAEFLAYVLAPAFPASLSNAFSYALDAFTKLVNPHLSTAEVEKLRPLVRPHLSFTNWPSDPDTEAPIAYHLAALLGMHAEIQKLVESWPDDRFRKTRYSFGYALTQRPLAIVFGLRSADLMQAQARRLAIPLANTDDLRGWLAHTEWNALDVPRDAIVAQGSKGPAEALTQVVCLVKAPEAAPCILELKFGSKAADLARAWLEEQPGNAIAGLIPVVAGRGRLADAALDYLRKAHSEGYAAFIEEQLAAAPPEAARRVREEVLENAATAIPPLDDATTPAPLRKVFQSAGTPRPLPDWTPLTSLPPLRLGNGRLNDEQVRILLSALQGSPLGTPSPVVTAIKEQVEPKSRDAFAWKLCELWLGEGAPSKEKWALLSVGHLGGDASVLKLTPLLRAWPGESQHQRAVTGLECLRAIGSDTALMQLNGIAQKLKFQGLKKKAQEFMEQIATDKGLSRAQLEDRIVPDLDLDEKGGRTFDFGPRQFTLALDADLKPLVRDDTGKLKADLPKPGAKDDAAKANAAIEEWKVLKKQLREVLKVQVFRLEQAMVTGRRWPVAEFETLLVRHPLMINLVRRLLWAGYTDKGKLVRLFRVTDESECADVADRPCSLKDVGEVGIVHPLHLSEEDKAAWGQVFGDYQIIPPFPQLGRPVYTLDKTEAKGREITRFAGRKVPGISLVSYLEKMGWQRGHLEDHGDFHQYYKYFPSADVTVVAGHEPELWVSNITQTAEVEVKRCGFLKGLVVPGWGWARDEKKLLPLKDVDPVVLSEALADLTSLTAKGQ